MTLVPLLLAIAFAAPGDDAAQARAQYDEGAAAFRMHRYVESALHFEAAAELRAHATPLYMAARSWEEANRPERAADGYARALAAPGATAEQERHCRERLRVLERALGTVVVTGAPGRRVRLDEGSETLVPARLHGVPGAHTLTVRDARGAARTITVDLVAAQTLQLPIRDEAPAAPAPAPVVDAGAAVARPAPPAPRGPPLRAVGWIVAGTGVAALATGAVLGWRATVTHDDYVASPTRDEYDRGRALVRGTNIALAAGGVLVAAGGALLLWPVRGSAVAVGPGGVALGGRF